MTEPKELEVIIFNQSDASSIFASFVGYGLLVGCCYLNYRYLGYSTLLQLALIFSWILGIMGYFTKNTKTIRGKKAFLEFVNEYQESLMNKRL